MSDLSAVWTAHRAADDLSNSLASYYEEGTSNGQTQLTVAQRQLLAVQHDKLRQLLAALGVTAGP
ncbi:hypothetical protein AQJ46_42340 [Streptomyces canus]|uniref:Uncharacterized protein n=1 Tax=Streptomyces canus TaxID=58343 RepID=A0A101RNV9_9ACTN|nr:hypothetical protein [Streptomyces canus]KUN58915.1 hypothetical protein AQJ46_42340 [Streptomyces canus]